MAIDETFVNSVIPTVKLSRGIYDDGSDALIKQKIRGAIDELRQRGVADKLIETATGIEAIVIYILDHWRNDEVKESQAWWNKLSLLWSNSLCEKPSMADNENENANYTKNHAELYNLEFEKSGHTGFANIEEIPAANLLFLNRENNTNVLTTQIPTTRQILLPMRWFAAEPETWQDVLTLAPASAISSQYFEIIQGNRFSAKIFLNSDVARTAARVRLQLIDTADNAILASATQIVDFPTINTINVPILFEGFYQTVRRMPLSRTRLVISVMTSLFGFQIQIISNPPDEISFISKTSTTTITEEQIREIVDEVLRRQGL